MHEWSQLSDRVFFDFCFVTAIEIDGSIIGKEFCSHGRRKKDEFIIALVWADLW